MEIARVRKEKALAEIKERNAMKRR